MPCGISGLDPGQGLDTEQDARGNAAGVAEQEVPYDVGGIPYRERDDKVLQRLRQLLDAGFLADSERKGYDKKES